MVVSCSKRLRQEFAGAIIDSQGQVTFNSIELADWLLVKKDSTEIKKDVDLGKSLYACMEQTLEKRLSEHSNRHLQPENMEIVTTAWCN